VFDRLVDSNEVAEWISGIDDRGSEDPDQQSGERAIDFGLVVMNGVVIVQMT